MLGTIRAAAFAALLAACVAACSKTEVTPLTGATSGTVAHGGVAFVDLDKVVAAHPMHAEVAALQDQINALNSQALVAPQATTPVQKEAAARLAQDLQNADAAFQGELLRKRSFYQQQEQIAIAALQSQALGQKGGGAAGMIAGMQQQYGSQIREMQTAAGKTLGDYRNALLKEDAQHLQRVQRELSAGVGARVRAKEQQLSDAETAYQVRLATQDQPQRLNLRAKLENLSLTDKERANIQSQLNDIETREAFLINQMKQKDQVELKSFIAAQNADATSRYIAERNATQTATNDKLRQRQQQLGTQMQQQVQTMGGQFNQQIAAANQQLARNPKVQTDMAHIHDQFQGQYMADANRALAAYQATRKALVDKYSAIAHLQFQDDQAIRAQIDQLAAQRRDLYAKVVDQVRTITAQIAQKEGFAVVLGSVRASSGAVDLTGPVARAVAGLPQTTPPPKTTAATSNGG